MSLGRIGDALVVCNGCGDRLPLGQMDHYDDEDAENLCPDCSQDYADAEAKER